MNEMKIFKNEKFGSVRVIMKDGEPWFVAKDVCELLELEVFKVNQRLDDDLLSKYAISDALGRSQETTIWNESALYDAIFDSRKPEAREFRKWVTGEVLPSIRKTGSYSMTPKDYIAALRALADAEEEKERLAFERNEAIRTKAHFVEGRDAEMCGRVGGLTRSNNIYREQNEDLKNRLGEGTRFKTVKAIPWLLKYFEDIPGTYVAVGNRLKQISTELGLDVKRIEDTRWGSVNAYDVEAIQTLKDILDRQSKYLDKYRKHETSAPIFEIEFAPCEV